MKKLIQIISILSLVVVFTAVAAKAGPVKHFTAQIPFDFNIGQKSYPAGTYVVTLTRISDQSTALSLEDTEGNQLQTVMVTTNGEVAKGEQKLVFNRYENQSFLTGILTREKGLSVPTSKAEKELVRKNRSNPAKPQVASAKLN